MPLIWTLTLYIGRETVPPARRDGTARERDRAVRRAGALPKKANSTPGGTGRDSTRAGPGGPSRRRRAL